MSNAASYDKIVSPWVLPSGYTLYHTMYIQIYKEIAFVSKMCFRNK